MKRAETPHFLPSMGSDPASGSGSDRRPCFSHSCLKRCPIGGCEGGISEYSARRGLAGVPVVMARFRFALDSVAGGLCLLVYLGIGIFTHTRTYSYNFRGLMTGTVEKNSGGVVLACASCTENGF
jgi:hypothetical protein